MTTPIAFRSTTYVSESLRLRVTDLKNALSHATNIPLGRSVSPTDPASQIVLEGGIRELVADIRDLASALESVWYSLDPVEAERSSVARGSLPAAAQYVMSGTPAIIRDARNGRLWALGRPLLGELVERIPRESASQNTVSLTSTNPSVIAAPVSLADRVSRIPGGDTHIRIERFDTPTGPRFEVYLSGTNFAGGPDDPWNAQSNLDLARSGSSPSLTAVKQALAEAGVTRESDIVITGHSQGGLLALALARSGDYTVDAVITVGTPVGVIPNVESVPSIHLVHPEDPVPALGGPIRADSSTWVIGAERGVTLFQAHDRTSYVPTAKRLDSQHETEVDALLARIKSGGIGESRDYCATVIGRNP